MTRCPHWARWATSGLRASGACAGRLVLLCWSGYFLVPSPATTRRGCHPGHTSVQVLAGLPPSVLLDIEIKMAMPDTLAVTPAGEVERMLVAILAEVGW